MGSRASMVHHDPIVVSPSMAAALALCSCCLLGCSKGEAIKCGPGTILRGDTCVIAEPHASAPPAQAAPLLAPTPPTAVTTNPDAPTPATSPWTYDSDNDKMRNITTDFAKNESLNEVDIGGPYGRVRLSIVLRKGPRFGNDVILHLTKGQIECGQLSGCSIALKFDDEPVRAFPAVESSSAMSSAIFLRKETAIIDKLKRAKKLQVEVNVFAGGTHQFEFDVSGLNWEPFKGKVVQDE